MTTPLTLVGSKRSGYGRDGLFKSRDEPKANSGYAKCSQLLTQSMRSGTRRAEFACSTSSSRYRLILGGMCAILRWAHPASIIGDRYSHHFRCADHGEYGPGPKPRWRQSREHRQQRCGGSHRNRAIDTGHKHWLKRSTRRCLDCCPQYLSQMSRREPA